MRIVNVPIIDYLKVCEKVAFKNNFVWVMVLLARERDAVHSYNDLKQFWDSYDDLTGDTILFLMSIANQRKNYYGAYLAQEEEEWKRLYNSELLIMNQNVPAVSESDFPPENLIRYYENLAIENNTHAVSELCRRFNISQRNVPSILLFSTEPDRKNNPVVIPIKSDDLYASLMSFMISIEYELEKYRNVQTELNNVKSALDEVEVSLKTTAFTNSERRFMTAKTKLCDAVTINSPEIDATLLQEAIEKKDIHACKLFPQPVRGYLNRIIDLKEQYEDIESRIIEKNLCEQKLSAKRIELNEAYATNCERLKEARNDLYIAAEKYVNDLQKKSVEEGRALNNRLSHFKIGVTFSGKYRKQFVEPFCEELLKLGYSKDDIFYDLWHEEDINGVNGDSELRDIYSKKCDCVVALLSPDYNQRNWTGHIEWPAIKELINSGDGKKICLLQVGSVNIDEMDGLYRNQAIFKSIDNMAPADVAAFIDRRYKKLL